MAKHTTEKTVEDIAMHHVLRKKGRIYFSNQPALSATFGKSRPSLWLVFAYTKQPLGRTVACSTSSMTACHFSSQHPSPNQSHRIEEGR